MLTNHPQNTRLTRLLKILACCSFFFLSLVAQGQSDLDSAVIEEVNTEPRVEPMPDSSYQSTEKEYFREKKESDSFFIEPRKLPPDLISQMKKDGDFWYADTAFKKEEEKVEENAYVPIARRGWFQTLLWVFIIGGFAAAIIWFLAGSQVALFRKKNEGEPSGEVSETIPEDIFAINYQKEIERATSQGNYRLAVRLLYLRLLKNLSDRDLIRFKQDLTNFDYLVQLRSTSYYPRFFRLTRHYEYSWYGHFDVEEPAYRIIRNEFDEMDQAIK